MGYFYMSTVPRIPPAAGQESVWDYPRPPRLEPVAKRVRIVFAGKVIADTAHAYRVLETSHPPVYYVPQADIDTACIERAARRSFCEFKGNATYWTVTDGTRREEDAAWSYENPSTGFEPIRGYLAFYAGRMDECTVGGEIVTPQPGGFYGGWITRDIVGPFKGGPGSQGW